MDRFDVYGRRLDDNDPISKAHFVRYRDYREEIAAVSIETRHLRGTLQELRARLHAAGRRPEECYEMSLIDEALQAENRMYSDALANATQDIERLRGLCNWAAGRLLDYGDVVGHEHVLTALERGEHE